MFHDHAIDLFCQWYNMELKTRRPHTSPKQPTHKILTIERVTIITSVKWNQRNADVHITAEACCSKRSSSSTDNLRVSCWKQEECAFVRICRHATSWVISEIHTTVRIPNIRNSFKKFHDPYCDPDRHCSLIVCCYSHVPSVQKIASKFVDNFFGLFC